jgi:hypothetical protein
LAVTFFRFTPVVTAFTIVGLTAPNAPEVAGGNWADGTVPLDRLLALRLVSAEPFVEH